MSPTDPISLENFYSSTATNSQTIERKHKSYSHFTEN